MTDKYKEEKQNLSLLATEQQMAAANPLHSVWVEASAGTGKTKVLSDRVLRLLLNKVNPQKILCLTYTKAAAVEMNERIAKRLSSWAVESEEDLYNDIKKLLGKDFYKEDISQLIIFARTLFATLLDTPGGMKIQTIHSFCQEILKRFPLEAGVSPYFEVLDTRNSKELLERIQINLLRQTADKNNSTLSLAVSYLTQHISEFKFPEVLNMITENRSKIDAFLNIYHNDMSLIKVAFENKLGLNYELTDTQLKQDFMNLIDKDAFKYVMNALFTGSKTDQKNAETFATIGRNNFSHVDFDKYQAIFLTEGKIRDRLVTKGVVTSYPSALEFMTREAERLIETKNKLSSLSVLHSSISLIYIAKYIIDHYNQQKKISSVLDYEDLIVITKNLLENKAVTDWVLFKLDGGIDHILIDEAQDTSPNQWAIIRALSQEFFAGLGAYGNNEIKRTIFVVGDRKQSIYSFQGADPQEFDKMYHYFEKKAQDFYKIRLDVSFRSTKAIMDCVNTLFASDEAKKGVVPDNEQINHCPYRLGEGGKVEIYTLTKSEKQNKGDDYNWHLPLKRESKETASATLAKQIAQNIKHMVESKEILSSKNRPIRYGDFMFLVQQRKSFVEEFVRACKEIGVNVSGVDKLKLLDQIAVQDLISLGKFLLLPSDDLSLAEVLKSPLFGLDDDDLFTLCYKRSDSLFNSLLKNRKYEKIAIILKKLLDMTGFIRPFELFTFVLVNLEGRKKFISRMGIEVEDVLNEFLNLALAFEQKHTPSLENFIFWIEQDEVIVQKEMEQGETDTVKIMTVHGSKGLQAPIVILADTTRTKNLSKKRGLLWDKELMYFPLSATDFDENCIQINNSNFRAELDEYRRLLYVALTRAEDRLYIAGFTNTESINPSCWYSLISDNISSNIENNDNSKSIIYEIKQENIVLGSLLKNTKPVNNEDYSYLLEKAPIENPLARPYAPSKNNDDEVDVAASPLEDNGRFYKRGTIIHKLLQYICDVALDKRSVAIMEFLVKHLSEYSEKEHLKICTEIMNLCDKYSDIFVPTSLAEVPIIGELDGKIISAKVDRLVITDNKVIIVDFKTNRPAARTLSEVPDIYLKQMKTYKQLLGKIYPDKEIETYLLWTNICEMMKI